MNSYRTTKGERREAKRRRRRKMAVSGTGVRNLQTIIKKRADKIRKQEDGDGRRSG